MNKNFWFILIIGFLLALCCAGLMQSVRAYDRVPQGGTVFLGERYDVSGVTAGYGQLVYIDEYADYMSPDNSTITYSIVMPQQKELYYNFSIDPEIFGARLGWWWHYNGFYSGSANDRAFRVVAVRPPINETVNNATFKNMTQVWVPKPMVAERHVADYLVARGDPLNLNFTVNKSTCWIFGRLDGIFNRPVVNQSVYFNASELENFEPGTYTIMFHSVGNDQNFDIRIVGDKLEYFDPQNFHVYSLNIMGLTPELVRNKILSVGGTSDDIFTMKTLELQNPYIEITTADVIEVSNLTGILQVRGYTNVANNSEVSFVLDKDKTPYHEVTDITRMQNTWYDVVKEYDNPGSMRYFDYGVPIVWDMLAPGLHDVTVRGAHNTSMTVPFYVYVAPLEPFKPNQTMKYVGGNLFVPTPTPEVIVQHEIVPGPKEYITIEVTVTPSDEQVHTEQTKVQWEFWTTIAGWAFLALIGIGIVGYAFLVWRRLK